MTPQNNSIKKVIEMAIEGGYKKDLNKNVLFDYFLDPKFWQALGTALGWYKEVWCYQQKFIPTDKVEGWLYHWHRFIDWLAKGEEPEEFFNQLLEK